MSVHTWNDSLVWVIGLETVLGVKKKCYAHLLKYALNLEKVDLKWCKILDSPFKLRVKNGKGAPLDIILQVISIVMAIEKDQEFWIFSNKRFTSFYRK